MTVGYQALYLCNRVSIAEPAALVATVLLSQTKRGINRNELKSDVMWLRNLILSHGGRVANFSPEYIEVVLSLILEPIVGENKLVKRHKDLLMVDLYSPEERMELSLYVNQIIHLFVEAGIISLVLYKQYKHDAEHAYPPKEYHHVQEEQEEEPLHEQRFIPVKDLIEDVVFLSSLLKLEFVFCPSSALKTTIDSTLLLLEELGTVEWGPSLSDSEEQDMGDNEEEDRVGEGKRSCVRVCSTREAQETYLFYAMIFWRFLDSYWLVALGFIYLLPDRVMTESSFISRLQRTGEKLYFEGQLDLFEAISRETLINAVSLFIKWGIIEHLPIEGDQKGGNVIPGRRVLRLVPDYQDEEELEALVSKIEEFRKSLKAYRSRRFLIRHTSETRDSIVIVKKDAKEMQSSSPPPSRARTRSPLPVPRMRRNKDEHLSSVERNPSPAPKREREKAKPIALSSFSSPFIAIDPPSACPPDFSLDSPLPPPETTPLISFLESRNFQSQTDFDSRTDFGSLSEQPN
uniref:GPAT/DHAPAT C-terminal domain-containing protein n=2 Tax=Paramoeba aestuarina TaxID=180227 RepID=A0A7S4KX37_9EUKA|mmetsp:Transcript_27235/g.42395  ORF Transcript_27235/g.42395 Transcript_27235/m.42395 type:complete len:517 (+) Transcript_27235:110-1660(+)